jgi:hypothetical protein
MNDGTTRGLDKVGPFSIYMKHMWKSRDAVSLTNTHIDFSCRLLVIMSIPRFSYFFCDSQIYMMFQVYTVSPKCLTRLRCISSNVPYLCTVLLRH